MKKIMFAVAIALVACIGQAANLNWSLSNVYDGNATDKASGATVMLFMTSYTSDGITPAPALTSISAVTALLDAGDLDGAKALAAATKTLNTSGTITGATGVGGFVAGDTVSAFAIFLDGSGDKYMVAQDAGGSQVLSKTWTNSSTAQTLAFGSQATRTQSATGWSSVGGGDVPEPTSGLLLLVGGALLALRRKQK